MTTDYFSLSEEERENAIKYLTDTIPDKEWSEVLAVMQREGESWTALAHFCFGMRVRNLLYEGPVTLQTADLDYEWAALVEEVIKRKFDYGFGREKGSFRKFTKPRVKD
jgi:hypothetical protein